MDVSPGRTRSFGGCSTCRSRHTKCDESRPACSICKHAGITCGGYQTNIFFDFEKPPDPSELRFRRPLLTEAERKCMSEWITSSVSPAKALHEIRRIEEEGDDASTLYDFQINTGPFGAFRLGPTELCLSREPHTNRRGNTLSEELGEVDQFCPSSEDLARPSAAHQLIQNISDQPSQHTLFDSMEFWNDINDINDSARIHEVVDEVEINVPEVHPPWTLNFPQTASASQSEIWNAADSIIPSELSVAVPHDAVFLLKHYSSTVLRLLTPFRHSKTPWHILFIPHVKNCLAALTLGETVDHASLCIFYGTLAISAFSLGGKSFSQIWHEQAKLYKQQAREQVRFTLNTAYDVPKTAKYKSVLMALLTMVQLSMVSGNRDQTECYLIEAEKFIRVKGLNRKKSRKVRLLHHCYAFERMFHESLFLGGTNSTHRHRVRQAIELSGAKRYSQDSLSFSLSDWRWTNLEEAMQRVKCSEEGENDLHLQLPGVWDRTLYPEIFGVPEQYIFLLSLTIRLAREKDEATTSSTTSPKDFLHRAKAVERCINQLQLPDQTSDVDLMEQNTPQTRPRDLSNILEAMQHALSIYFYRHVYDIDNSLLQHKVTRVRDCLLRCESAETEDAYGAARLVWPAFIAASEAEDLALQNSFSLWFKASATKSGLNLFTDALANLERVWERKARSRRIEC